jgi:hypothetical protein
MTFATVRQGSSILVTVTNGAAGFPDNDESCPFALAAFGPNDPLPLRTKPSRRSRAEMTHEHPSCSLVQTRASCVAYRL